MRTLATPGRLVLVSLSTHDDRLTHIADRVIELVPHFSGADREPEEVRLEAGQILFHQGDRGDLVYAVEEGEIEIYRIRADGSEEPVTVVGPGNYFGERPMFNLPRSASARARTASCLTACSLRAFRRRFPSASSAPAGAGVTDGS